MDRRTFLARTALGGVATYGLAACANGSDTPEAASGSAMSDRDTPGLDRLGVQLYTVRDQMEQDVPGTLAAVAGMGYAEVETAGVYGLEPSAFRAELDRAGLVSPAGHYGMNNLRGDLDGTLATAQTLGQRWVIVPSLDGSERNPEGFRRVADDLNRFAAVAIQRDLRIGYHNHDFEFASLDDPELGSGTHGLEILLASTDPDLVDFELDLFWTVRGGVDPIDLFRRHPGRFPLCHVKDMADIQGARRMTEVGAGEIDFGSIFAQSELAGLRHYFVEHDNPDDSLASIRTSHDYLRGAGF